MITKRDELYYAWHALRVLRDVMYGLIAWGELTDNIEVKMRFRNAAALVQDALGVLLPIVEQVSPHEERDENGNLS